MSAVFEGLPVKSVSIDNMLRQCDGVIERVHQALDLLTEADHMAGAAGIGFPRMKLDESRYSVYNMLDAGSRDEVNLKITRAIDATGWRHLMNESGMRSLMDAKARQQWDESIEKGEFPAFTRENIVNTFQDLHGSRDDIFERGVLAVFKSLSWCYKTNSRARLWAGR